MDDISSSLYEFDWPALLKLLDFEMHSPSFFQCSLPSVPRNIVKFSGKDKPWITYVVKVLINKR